MDAVLFVVLWIGAAALFIGARKRFSRQVDQRAGSESGSWSSMVAALAITLLMSLGAVEFVAFVLSAGEALQWVYLLGAIAVAAVIMVLAIRLSRPRNPGGHLPA